MIKQNELEAIKTTLELLPVLKKWRINNNGNKVKVVRNEEAKYSTYHNGHYITTDTTWAEAFELVKALLQTK